MELIKEALANQNKNNDKLSDEVSALKVEVKNLKREISSSQEKMLVNNSKFKTQINSLETENAQLKKHINSLYSQLDQKGMFISKISRLV